MSEQEKPLAALLGLVRDGASGEFVCVSSTCELHVYLQSGRIAWATDSTLPFAFSRHLLENTSLAKETFHEVLEACRHDRLPLGETLIEWHVVTREEIRAALMHQIRAAMESLRGCAKGHTIFLERQRQFASYATELTFDMRELVPVAAAPVSGTLERVRSKIPEPAWLELFEGEVVLEQLPAAVGQQVPACLLQHSVLDGADVIAVRTARGTLIGVALPEPTRTLWCRLEVETAFGTTLAALCQYASIGQTNAPSPPAAEEGSNGSAVRAVGDGDRAGSVAMRTFMERAPEIDGVLLMENDEPVCGVARRRSDPERMKAIVRRRVPMLDVILPEMHEPTDLDELGYRLKSLVTGEEQVWCFGAELGSEPKRTLWLFTDRQCAQGLGWAYLTSLSRQLATVDKDENAKNE
jgi:hypothetical protein